MDLLDIQEEEYYKPKAGDLCHYCNKGNFVMRESRYGAFLGCSRFPQCVGKVNLKDEKDDLEKEADKWLREH